MRNEWFVGGRESLVARGAVSLFAMTMAVALPTPSHADPPRTTVAYQPMISTGLAARNLFEAWFIFDKSSDPAVPGYAIPEGATIRFTFPKAFTPKADHPPEAVMIKWEQGAVATKFTTTSDPRDPRTISIHFNGAVAPDAGLKAIHLRTSEINPVKAGDYAITVEFVDAGPLSGTTRAITHITSRPVSNVAPYNQLHPGKNEDWQRVKVGADAPLPIDFLVTVPNAPRSVISLKATGGGGLRILRDEEPIGSITTSGAPVTLTPETFGPGFSRLGIVEVRAKAGAAPGNAEIFAALEGGARCVIHLIVEGP